MGIEMDSGEQRQVLHHVLKGNVEAIEFCEMVFGISQVLDDLIDGDKPTTQLQIIGMMWNAIVELPENDFYRRHERFLRPLLASALQDWTDSVRLEKGELERGKHLAFVLRDQLTSVVVQCARLIGGFMWMQQVSESIRLFFHDEELDVYMDGLKKEKES